MSGVDFCVRCVKRARSKCSKCKQVSYCSTECQKKDWELGHRERCKELRRGNTVDSFLAGDGNALNDPDRFLMSFSDIKDAANSKPALATPGHPNVGNTCFANASLQSLLASPAVVGAMMDEKITTHTCSGAATCVLCDFRKYILTAETASAPFVPHVVRTLKRKHGNFGIGEQEDAHDFLSYTINALHESFISSFDRSDLVGHRVTETTPIWQLFGGYLQSKIVCSAGHVSNLYEGFKELSVEVTEHTQSVGETLEAFTQIERLSKENKFHCDSCGGAVTARKQLLIRWAPNVLILHLKRFRQDGYYVRKLDQHVAFEETLYLDRYLSNKEKGADPHKLFAVVVHLSARGHTYSGHYVCFVKNQAGKWFCVDDETVIPVEQRVVFAQPAYLLLYQRASFQPLPGWSPEKLKKRPKAAKPSEESVASERSLCIDGCGFYGTPELEGRCSVCAKRQGGGASHCPSPSNSSPAEGTTGATEAAIGEITPDMVEAMLAQMGLTPQSVNRSVNNTAPVVDTKGKKITPARVAQPVDSAEAHCNGTKKQNPASAKAPQPPAPAPTAPPAPSAPPQAAVGTPRLGRNDPCPCGSGRKYKKCHEKLQ